MKALIDHQPGEPAPASGLYRQVDPLGLATDIRVLMTRGDPLPHAPEGCGWRRQRETDAVPPRPAPTYRRPPVGTRPTVRL